MLLDMRKDTCPEVDAAHLRPSSSPRRAHRHLPLAGFWSKDEILAGASQLGGSGHYTVFMIIGIVGAFMTAAYMTRTIWYTFFGEFRPRASPRVRAPHRDPAVDPGGGGDRRPGQPALGSPPTQAPCGSSTSSSPRALLPDGQLGHPEFSSASRGGSTIIGLAGITLAYLWYCGSGPTASSRSATGRPRPATRCSTSTTSTTCTPTSSSPTSRAPSPGASTGSTRT